MAAVRLSGICSQNPIFFHVQPPETVCTIHLLISTRHLCFACRETQSPHSPAESPRMNLIADSNNSEAKTPLSRMLMKNSKKPGNAMKRLRRAIHQADFEILNACAVSCVQTSRKIDFLGVGLPGKKPEIANICFIFCNIQKKMHFPQLRTLSSAGGAFFSGRSRDCACRTSFGTPSAPSGEPESSLKYLR